MRMTISLELVAYTVGLLDDSLETRD